MTEMFQEIPPDDWQDEFDAVADLVALYVADGEDFPSLLRTLRDRGPDEMPTLWGAALEDEAVLRAVVFQFGRFLWNATPSPSNRWRPRPVPKPDRNAPCPCGSGEKHKKCCAGGALPPMDSHGLNMLGRVLEHVPEDRYAELVATKVPPEDLDLAAATWLDRGDADRAIALLEPLFEDIDRLDWHARGALETLLDAYTDAFDFEARDELLERAAKARDPEFRSEAWQRLCTSLAEEGKAEAAWAAFEQASALAPRDPALSYLEVTTLQALGETEKARSRGRWWIGHLEAEGNPELDNLISLLRNLIDPAPPAAEPEAVPLPPPPGLDALIALVAAVPAPHCAYRLEASGEGTGTLLPDDALAALEDGWNAVSPYRELDSPADPATSPEEISDLRPAAAWLEAHPQAWQSLRVLSDVSFVLEEERDDANPREGMPPLLQQAQALLAELLGTGPVLLLPVAQGHNAAALELIGLLLLYLPDDSDEWTTWLERLVAVSVPEEDTAYHAMLLDSMFAKGRAAEALPVIRRFGISHPATQIHGALGLFQAGMKEEATALLTEAHARTPEYLDLLLATKPKRPPARENAEGYDARAAAWQYRSVNRVTWQEANTLEWAARVRGGAPSAGGGA